MPPERTKRRSLRLALVPVLLVLVLGAVTKDRYAPASFRLDRMVNSVMVTQGLAKAGTSHAFNLERIGCVAVAGDVKVSSITLHAPTSHLVLTDWGARAAGPTEPAAIDWGIFSPEKHPLHELGLGKTGWSGHCGTQVEQLVVVAQLPAGSRVGAAAGFDLHFTDGTTTWVPYGIGVCVRRCPRALIDRTLAAIDEQRGWR